MSLSRIEKRVNDRKFKMWFKSVKPWKYHVYNGLLFYKTDNKLVSSEREELLEMSQHLTKQVYFNHFGMLSPYTESHESFQKFRRECLETKV